MERVRPVYVVFDPNSPESIVENLRGLYGHWDQARIMGEKGKASILGQYNWEIASKDLVDEYQKLD